MSSSFKQIYPAFKVFLGILVIQLCILSLGAESGSSNKPKSTVVVIHCEYSPISFMDKSTGLPSGFFVDIMNSVAGKTGLNVSYICKNAWDVMIESIVKGEAELGALMKSEEREKKLLFSMPIETSYLSFFARSQSEVDASVIPSGYITGVIRGSMSHEKLKARPDVSLHLYDSYREGLFGLLAGEIVLFAGEESMVNRQVNETNLGDHIKKRGKPFLERQRCLAVRKDNGKLLVLMNKTLDSFIGSPEYQQIYLKWYGAPEAYWTNKRILTLSGIVFLIIVIGMAIWRYMSISKINAELLRSIEERKRAEEIISRSLKEKEVLLKEIHHRVKNNMQVIYSLLSLQEDSIDDKNIQALFKESRNRVYTMAMIHEKLYQSEDLSHIDFREYLQNLVLDISETYMRNDVRLSVDMESIHLDVNAGIPCGLIVNELITNSLKYAFPEGRKGEIRVGINRNAKGEYVLFVADNGIGFPDAEDFYKSSSLGLQLVNMLTKQLGGSVLLSRAGGTMFTVTFPEKNNNKAKIITN